MYKIGRANTLACRIESHQDAGTHTAHSELSFLAARTKAIEQNY